MVGFFHEIDGALDRKRKGQSPPPPKMRLRLKLLMTNSHKKPEVYMLNSAVIPDYIMIKGDLNSQITV